MASKGENSLGRLNEILFAELERHHRSAIAGLIAQAELLDQKMREVG